MRTRSALAPPGRGGFSLVEILVVLVMLGILLGIAWSAIDPVRSQVESAMLNVGSTLQRAQREAVARQHDVIVTFDLDNNLLILHEDANNNGAVDGGERTRSIQVGEAIAFSLANATPRAFGDGPISFPDGASGLPEVTFRRNGSASAAGGLYLTSLRAAGGDTRRTNDTRAMEIARATGRVEWFRFVGGAWKRGF